MSKMPKNHHYVFVLWADEFEEHAATTFITELREAGLRVKMVGLTPQPIRGAHGVVLAPDLTLDQALSLAAKAICLVMPYASPGIKRLKNDPRLVELFRQARVNQAWFVLGQLPETDIAASGLLPRSSEQIMIYPDSEDLVTFARELAGLLVGAI
jgi:hypothetical protein